MTFASRDQSPQSTEPSTPFFPSLTFPQTYSTDLLTQSPEVSGVPACHLESGCLGSTVSNGASPGMQVGNYQDVENLHDSWGALRSGNSMGDSVSLNQPNIYVATGKLNLVFFFTLSSM